jgi:hypothetical protein
MRNSARVSSPADGSAAEASSSILGASSHPFPLADQTSGTTNHELRWRHITRSLGAHDGEAEPPATATRERRNCRPAANDAKKGGNPPNVHIEVIEHSTPACAVISWRDSTSCCYGYQVWRQATSRRAGVCALSGAEIRRGDEIFQPYVRYVLPANAAAMILAANIDLPQFAAQ